MLPSARDGMHFVSAMSVAASRSDLLVLFCLKRMCLRYANSEIFELFQLFIIRSELMKGCIEISRSDFEAYLDNDDLRMAYVDVFHPDNRYFYSLEEEFEDQKLTKSDEGFVIIRDEVFQMMFIL